MITSLDSDEPRIFLELSYHFYLLRKYMNKSNVREDGVYKSDHVWDLIHLPLGHQAIVNVWVSHMVRKAESTIERYKVQLVANEETYSLEVKFSCIRVILAIATYMNLKLHQMDVMMVLL